MESTEHRQVFVEPSAFKHFSDSSFQLFHGSMKLIFPYSIGSGCFHNHFLSFVVVLMEHGF